MIIVSRQGQVGLGAAVRGAVWFGKARRGKAGMYYFDNSRQGQVRPGDAWSGKVGRGTVRFGVVRRGMDFIKLSTKEVIM